MKHKELVKAHPRSIKQKARLYKEFKILGIDRLYEINKKEFRNKVHLENYLAQSCKNPYHTYYKPIDIAESNRKTVQEIYNDVINPRLKYNATIGDCKGKTKEDIEEFCKMY